MWFFFNLPKQRMVQPHGRASYRADPEAWKTSRAAQVFKFICHPDTWPVSANFASQLVLSKISLITWPPSYIHKPSKLSRDDILGTPGSSMHDFHGNCGYTMLKNILGWQQSYSIAKHCPFSLQALRGKSADPDVQLTLRNSVYGKREYLTTNTRLLPFPQLSRNTVIFPKTAEGTNILGQKLGPLYQEVLGSVQKQGFTIAGSKQAGAFTHYQTVSFPG